MPPKRKLLPDEQNVKKDFCTKNLLFPGQYGTTCWFNALLLCILYSQRSRKLMIKASRDWDMKIKVLELFKYILKYKYVRTKKPTKDVKFFETINPEMILTLLHKYDSEKFMLNDFTFGFSSIMYLRSMYELFGLSCIGLTLYKDNVVAYDSYNKIHNVTFFEQQFRYLFQKMFSVSNFL